MGADVRQWCLRQLATRLLSCACCHPLWRGLLLRTQCRSKRLPTHGVKTDKVDAKILAQLHAAGFLPEVWAADDDTLNQRRLVSERNATVKAIRRLKSRVQAVLHANLVPKYAGKLFTKGGRRWLIDVPLPEAEKDLLGRHLDELDWITTKLETLDADFARRALDDPRARKLMTITGIDSIVATIVLASIGDISRFQSPENLASYFGLTPRVRQSGERGPIHGRISKQGNTAARTMLIEAAWSASASPGPLRAFFLRIKDRKGANIAATATARKIAKLIWHLLTKDQPYQWARPAFVAMKLRRPELQSGAPRAHGKAGPARDYWIKELREREMALVENAETAYAKMVEAWKDRPPKPKKV